MIEGIPSITAGFVAFARGVATASPMVTPHVEDRVARSLLPVAVAALIPPEGHRTAPYSQSALRVLSGGLVDHIALRTAAIDHAVHEGVKAGALQIVLLGAGLDARAYRLPFLAGVTVFEVDHPATQRYRQARMPGVAPTAREVVCVPVDFARDSLAERLTQAGHDPHQPTIWVWEGVTMYLPRDATRATLAVISARSAPRSTLAVTYMTPEILPALGPIQSVIRLAFRSLGEPMLGPMRGDEIEDELRVAGFTLQSDETSIEWASRFGGNRWLPGLFRSEHLVVATS